MPLDKLLTADAQIGTGHETEASYRATGPAIPPPPIREPFQPNPALRRLFAPELVTPPAYELVGELGRGGMGIVYEARHLRLGRTVALKVLRPDRARPGGPARLRGEAETAARLQHSNIVQLYEFGEHDGVVFLSLEYVAGGSLAARLAEAPLTVSESASLVETLARAVAYAHSQGVVHRDLKPANVMLASARAADRLVPKITDFGLAKRLGSGDDQSLSGAVLGTPSYLAPEQATGRAKDAGPAADIYALGAILYECLAGRPPFRAATALETLDQVRTLDPVPPRSLQPSIPRDLEVICLKCLPKEPGRRYPTAAALADDLARFRRGEPIQARPVGPAGRLLKWVRRQPRVAALTGLCVLAGLTLLVGGVGSYSLLRVAAARTEARHRLSLEAIDRFLSRVGEERLTNLPEMEAVRRDLLEDALGFYRRLLAESDGSDPALRLEAGLAAMRMGDIQRLLGRLDESAADHREALAQLGALAAESPANALYRRRLADAHLRAGLTATARQRVDDAEADYRAAEGLLRPLAVEQPADEGHVAQLAAALSNLDVLEETRGRLELAEAAGREALAFRQRLADAHPGGHLYRVDLAVSHHNLCGLLIRTGRIEPALDQGERARSLLEKLHEEAPREFTVRSDLSACCNNLGAGYTAAGRTADAEACHRRALELRTALAHDYPLIVAIRMSLVETRNNLGDLYFTTGRHADAEPQYRAAVALFEAPGGTATAAALGSLAEIRISLALLLQTTGRQKESVAEYAAAQTVLAKLVADYPDQTRYVISLASCYVNRALLARVAERPEDALPWCDKALTLLGPVRARVPAHADARATEKNAHGTKAQVLESLGRYADAIPDWDRVVELETPLGLPVSRFLRATALVKAGDYRRAVSDIAAISDEPRWGPAEAYDLARVAAAALRAVTRDERLSPAEREHLSADYARRTAALLNCGRPAGRAARWGYMANWGADPEFEPFLRRPECQAVVAGLELLR